MRCLFFLFTSLCMSYILNPKILTGKFPFHQCYDKYEQQLTREAWEAALKRKEIPSRELLRGDVEMSDNIWDTLKRCWDYNPSTRSTADELQAFWSALNTSDDRLSDAMPQRPPDNIVIDYERVHAILRNVSMWLLRDDFKTKCSGRSSKQCLRREISLHRLSLGRIWTSSPS
jgi:serine/threonine protein kinase